MVHPSSMLVCAPFFFICLSFMSVHGMHQVPAFKIAVPPRRTRHQFAAKHLNPEEEQPSDISPPTIPPPAPLGCWEILATSPGEKSGVRLCREPSPRSWILSHSSPKQSYTVLRAEFRESWCARGQKFHLSRLRNGWRGGGRDGADEMSHRTGRLLDQILKHLRQDAYAAGTGLAALTVLWSPCDSGGGSVAVHAAVLPPPPAAAPGSRALLVPDRDDLPCRHRGRDPGRLKDADWILRRAPIEKLTLKGGERAELIMTRQGRDAMELLEGLTSNVFVLYKGGTLKNKI